MDAARSLLGTGCLTPAMKSIFTFLASALLAAATTSAGPLTEAKVTKIINEVSVVEPSSGARKAELQDVIKGQTGLKTGIKSRSELMFQDNTLTRIGPESYFSFKAGTRDMTLEEGTMLLQVPKGLGGAKIRTAAVTAAITGTTIMLEYRPKQNIKVIVLEGSLRLSANGSLGDSVLLEAGKMVIMPANAKRIPDPVSVDIKKVMKTSSLVNMGGNKKTASLPSAGLIAKEIAAQQKQKDQKTLVDTNLVILGKGTNVVLASDDLLASLDRNANISTALVASNTTTTNTPAQPAPVPNANPASTPAPVAASQPNTPPASQPGATPIAQPGSTPAAQAGSTPPPQAAATPAAQPGSTPPLPDAGATPAVQPGSTPAASPGSQPTATPAANPTATPVVNPTATPGAEPTATPVVNPTATPGAEPTATPGAGATPPPGDNPVPSPTPTTDPSATPPPAASPTPEPSATPPVVAGDDDEDESDEDFDNVVDRDSDKDLTVDSPIDVSKGGRHGKVNLKSRGTVIVKSTIKVSDKVAPNVSQRGGSISIRSHKKTGTAIAIRSSAQLLSLLDGSAPGSGGTIKFRSAGGAVNVNGAKIQADRGTIDMSNSGEKGVISVQNANLSANTIKLQALGKNGQLNIGGGTLSADSAISLYAGGSNGQVNFNDNVTLTGSSVKTIAGHSVTIANDKTVTVSGSGGPARVFTNNPNYTGSGGNGSTSGRFGGAGATTQPFSDRPGGG